MNTYFVADSHHGHAKIIKLSNRPFATVEEMNATMVERWNQTVGADDTVWFLGDLCWKGYENIFFQLNGQKHLIIGNHDHHNVLSLPWASQPKDRVEIKLADSQDRSYRIVLDHYPLEEWCGYFRGSLHFHGHVHAKKLNDIPNRFDVGVDNTNFYPVDLDHILQRITPKPPNRE